MHDRDRRVRLHFVLSAELLEAVLFVDDSVLTGGRLGGDERCAVVAHHGIPAGAPPSNRLCQACRMQGVAEGSQHLRKDAQHLPLGKCFAPSCSDHVRQLPARTVPVADMPSPPVVQLVPVAEMPSPPVVQRPIAVSDTAALLLVFLTLSGCTASCLLERLEQSRARRAGRCWDAARPSSSFPLLSRVHVT